jgi:hypothetical protein
MEKQTFWLGVIIIVLGVILVASILLAQRFS